MIYIQNIIDVIDVLIQHLFKAIHQLSNYFIRQLTPLPTLFP